MKILDSEFYGDKNRWFIGVVTNNNDPRALGRVQVRIHGIHSGNPQDIPFEDLPWAYTMVPTTEGGNSGIGRIPQILPGSKVYGIFIDGETSQLPLVIGSLPKIEQRTEAQTGGTAREEEYIPKEERKNYPFDLDSRRSQGMRFFIDYGYTVEQAAGIMGNLEHESGLDTEIPYGGKRNPETGEIIVDPDQPEKSTGIAQWNPAAGRLQELKKFAANNLEVPRDWRDYDVQLLFVLYELNNTEGNANGKLKASTKIDGGVSLANSTYVFGKYYERPDAQVFLESLSSREAKALKAYRQHVGRA